MSSGRIHLIRRMAIGMAFAALPACELAKSTNPTSPSVAGPIAGVSITAPTAIEPNGSTIAVDKQPITLVIGNATTNGQRALTYSFEVAADANFSTRIYTRDGVPPGEGGRTSLQLPDALATGRSYYWRAKAADGANTGPHSAAARFDVITPKSLDKPVLLAPSNNEQLSSMRPTFRWNNAPRSGPVGDIKYTVEVSDIESFARASAVWQVNEQPNQTTYQSPQDWGRGLYLFWRVRASSMDGADEGPWSDPRAFAIQRIVIGRPNLLSPAPNERLSNLQPTFLWDNSSRSGPVGSITYTVEVSNGESFGNKLAIWQVPEQSNQTRYVSPQNWSYDQVLFWRVRATDGAEQSEWAVTRAFALPSKPAPAPPPVPSGGGGGGGGTSGGVCNSSSPSAIVECERNKYGYMSSSQLVDFLRAAARSLTRNGINGSPFGLLRKGGGHNCLGFSCDILCSGQGGGQRQFDVLGDVEGAQSPGFSEIFGTKRIDVCEIQ